MLATNPPARLSTGPVAKMENSDVSPSCVLAALAALFQPQRLAPPLSSVALRPERPHDPSSEEEEEEETEDHEADERGDYVVETLRAAPLSLFREPAGGSSSSANVLPPRLECPQVSPSSRTAGKTSPSAEKRQLSSSTTPSSSPSSSSSDVLRSVTTVLSMLSCVLQRSPTAYGLSSNHSKLLGLLLDHGFVARAAEDMAELWRRCCDICEQSEVSNTSTPISSVQAEALATLSLYCDVLLLLVCHCRTAGREKEGGATSGSASSTSKSNAKQRTFFAAVPTSLWQTLYTLNQTMGAALAEAAAAPVLLRRSVASLTAFLVQCAPHLPTEVTEAALRDLEGADEGTSSSTARSNMAHMVFIAALPTMCAAMPQAWQSRALAVVRQATLYDADVDVAYAADDGPSAVVRVLALAQFSATVRGFVAIMSEMAWCFCTADALVHLCRAVSVYGGGWRTYPVSYKGLVRFLHRALLRHHRAYEKPPPSVFSLENKAGAARLSSGRSDALAIVEQNRRVGAAPPRLLERSMMESLLDRTVRGAAEDERWDASRLSQRDTAGEGTASTTKRSDLRKANGSVVPSFAEKAHLDEESDAETPMGYLLRCEADPASPRSFVFYLALFAYVTCALPPLLHSFEELSHFFTLSESSGTSSSRSSPTASAAMATTTEKQAEAAALPAPRTATVPLFALCLEHLRVHLAASVGGAGTHSSDANGEETQRRLLCEASVSLLTAFMCSYPHSLQRLEDATSTAHLVRVTRDVIVTVLRAPRASYQMRRAAITLLYRYISAVDTTEEVIAQMMQPSAWAALSSDSAEYVQATFYDALRLHRHLCFLAEDVGPREVGCALTTFAELPAGVFSTVLGGAALATAAVHAVFDLRELCARDGEMLFESVTVPQLPALCSRLGEAVDTLLQAQNHGTWVAAGRSTWQSTHVAEWLLHKTVTMYRVPALLTTAAFPVAVPSANEAADRVVRGVGNEAGRRSRNVLAVCLAVLCDTDHSAPHRSMAELVAAALQASAEQHRAQEAFQALRSALSDSEAETLRETLIAVQQASTGAVANTLRLEVWLAMVRWCPALFVFLFGPSSQRGSAEDDNDADDNTRVSSSATKKEGASSSSSSGGDGVLNSATLQPEKLPFAKLLGATLRSADASVTEKALALQVLRHSELFTVVSVKEVAAVLLKGGGAVVKDTTEAIAACEAAVLATACVAYVNAVLAGQLTSAKHTATEKAADGDRASPLSSDAWTPQHRPNLTPLSPPSNSSSAMSVTSSPVVAARVKVVANHADTTDQLLRHAPSVLDRCRGAYERESREVRYEDVFEWVARHTSVTASGVSGGLSTSVVLPRRGGGGGSSSCHGHRGLLSENGSAVDDGGSLAYRRTPTALSTAASRVSSSHLSAMAVVGAPLLPLDGAVPDVLLPHHRLIPVGASSTRFFRGTGDDARLNLLASLLDSAAELCVVVEQLLWCSGLDVNSAGLFQKRTQSVLESAVNTVVASRPSSPLLGPLLAAHVQSALRLARAASGVLESSLGGDGIEAEVAPSLQRALLRLAAFVKVNRHARSLVVEAVPIVTAFPLTSLAEQTAVEALLREAQAMLHDQLANPLDEDAGCVCDTVVEGCRRYFSRQRADPSGACGAVVDVVLLSRLLPTLQRYLGVIAQSVQPAQPACASAHRFAGVLACLSCILVQCGNQAVVLGFLSEHMLLDVTRALGEFAQSSVFDHVAHGHHRLSWHVCWQAVLSFWSVVASLGGPCSAKAAGWLPSLTAALESVPRFAIALGAFRGPHGANRQELLVWEVEEMDVATCLAAALALQDVPLTALVPSVQAGFLFLQQPRLQKLCVSSVPSAEASASEWRRITTAQAHALRNALTVLLKQPSYAVPRDGALLPAFVFPPALTGGAALMAAVANEAEPDVLSANALVHSLDLLRQYTVRELQLLRRLTVGSAGAARERSPDGGRLSTGSVASRESSVTRSPSRGHPGDGETLTEMGDDFFAVDGSPAEAAADLQAVHLETVQLALNAFALTVEDLIDNATFAPGGLYTTVALQTIRHTTERLLHTLGRLAQEVRDLRRPLLSHIVQTKTRQLTAVLKRL